MNIKYKIKFTFFIFILFFFSYNLSESQNFSNPLRFYKTDVLSYLQTLYKNQEYEKISNYVVLDFDTKYSHSQLVDNLKEIQFGYKIKKVGIKESINKSTKSKEWIVTYDKNIIATKKTFSIKCISVKDTCKLYLDKTNWELLFNSKFK